MLKLLCCTREDDVNTQDVFGMTKLHHAARDGQYEEVRRLVERGADVNIKTKYAGATAVMLAATWGHREIVEYLHQEDSCLLVTSMIDHTTTTRILLFIHFIILLLMILKLNKFALLWGEAQLCLPYVCL